MIARIRRGGRTRGDAREGERSRVSPPCARARCEEDIAPRRARALDDEPKTLASLHLNSLILQHTCVHIALAREREREKRGAIQIQLARGDDDDDGLLGKARGDFDDTT